MRWPCHLPIVGIETRFFKPVKFVPKLSQIKKPSWKKSRLPRQQVTSAMVANLRWYNLEFQISCLCSTQVRVFGKDKQPSAVICMYKNLCTKPKRSQSFLHFVIIALLFTRDEQLQDWRGFNLRNLVATYRLSNNNQGCIPGLMLHTNQNMYIIWYNYK